MTVARPRKDGEKRAEEMEGGQPSSRSILLGGWERIVPTVPSKLVEKMFLSLLLTAPE